MGIPLSIKVMSSCLNPLILSSASPLPPPFLTLKIPGIVCRIRGSGLSPSFDSIALALITETETGILVSFLSPALIIISSMEYGNDCKVIVPMSFWALTSFKKRFNCL